MFLSNKIPREEYKEKRCGQWWKKCVKIVEN